MAIRIRIMRSCNLHAIQRKRVAIEIRESQGISAAMLLTKIYDFFLWLLLDERTNVFSFCRANFWSTPVFWIYNCEHSLLGTLRSPFVPEKTLTSRCNLRLRIYHAAYMFYCIIKYASCIAFLRRKMFKTLESFKRVPGIDSAYSSTENVEHRPWLVTECFVSPNLWMTWKLLIWLESFFFTGKHNYLTNQGLWRNYIPIFCSQDLLVLSKYRDQRYFQY